MPYPINHHITEAILASQLPLQAKSLLQDILEHPGGGVDLAEEGELAQRVRRLRNICSETRGELDALLAIVVKGGETAWTHNPAAHTAANIQILLRKLDRSSPVLAIDFDQKSTRGLPPTFATAMPESPPQPIQSKPTPAPAVPAKQLTPLPPAQVAESPKQTPQIEIAPRTTTESAPKPSTALPPAIDIPTALSTVMILDAAARRLRGDPPLTEAEAQEKAAMITRTMEKQGAAMRLKTAESGLRVGIELAQTKLSSKDAQEFQRLPKSLALLERANWLANKLGKPAIQ